MVKASNMKKRMSLHLFFFCTMINLKMIPLHYWLNPLFSNLLRKFYYLLSVVVCQVLNKKDYYFICLHNFTITYALLKATILHIRIIEFAVYFTLIY